MEGLALYNIFFKPKILKKYFDLKVREQCKQCKRYGHKQTCPPNVESIDYYRSLLPTYKYGELYVFKFQIDDINNWEELGKESTKEITKHLLYKKAAILQLGFPYVVAFSAGSCKNCDTCSVPCRMPNQALIPIEATGLDVMKLVKDLSGVRLVFPVRTVFYRIGMILYG